MPSASSTLRVNAFPNGCDNTRSRQIVYGICILSPSGTYINSANAYSGIPLNWGNMQDGNFGNNPTFQPQAGPWVNNVAGALLPQTAFFFSTGNEATIPGYNYIYNVVPGTGSTTLRILSGGTELTNGASITTDNIAFEAEFIKGI